jgi:hypothetical protein
MMKARISSGIICACFLVGSLTSLGATYYINDDYVPVSDVYTTATGHDSNNGTTPSTPKRTLAGLFADVSLSPGDTVYIDTGTYGVSTIPATVLGTAEAPIIFQGSTNLAAGGTVFNGTGSVLDIRGSRLIVRDMTAQGGNTALFISGSMNCRFERVKALGSRVNSAGVYGANSNVFSHCMVHKTGSGTAFGFNTSCRSNFIENSVMYSQGGYALGGASNTISDVSANIIVGVYGLNAIPYGGSRNIFSYTAALSNEHETLSDLQRENTNWFGNVVADPLFVNADALDFHVMSPAGFVSNGVWVTNALVGYSPAIDFGKKE